MANVSDPIAVVDTALSFAVRREVLTAEEAMDLLFGVLNKVHDGELDEVIRAVVADAAESEGAEMLVDRSRVIDRLLDIRLVLQRPGE
jgi:hypothetical protein